MRFGTLRIHQENLRLSADCSTESATTALFRAVFLRFRGIKRTFELSDVARVCTCATGIVVSAFRAPTGICLIAQVSHLLSRGSVPPDWREMERSSGCGSQGGRMAPMRKAHCTGITPVTTTLMNQATAAEPTRSSAIYARFSLHAQTFWSKLDSLVGVAGIEPATSSFSVTCSNQLSYTPRPSRAGINMAMLQALLESYKAIPSLLPSRERFPLVWN